MSDLAELFNNLKLLYYEYDKYQNKFIKDTNHDSKTVYNDLMKLTYELSKDDIQFYIDNNSDIVICEKSNMLEKVKHKIKNIKYHFENSNKNIYILSDTHVKYASNIPMITTVAIKKNLDLDKYDAMIFTSKNAIRHLNSITDKWKDIPSYAISTQTAKEIKKSNGKLAFIGKEKYGDKFALELVDKLAQYKKVAYIGAKEVVSDLANILNAKGIDCDHIAVYETLCIEYKEKMDLPDDSTIIFSSPSCVKCFFKNVNWKENFKAISIGNTTKKYFPQSVKPIVSDNATLQSCVQKAINIKVVL